MSTAVKNRKTAKKVGKAIAAAPTAISQVTISGLGAAVHDARRAALDGDRGPADPTEFSSLMGRLEASRDRLPPLYRQIVLDPFARELRELGSLGFAQVLMQDPRRERLAGLMLDIAQSVL